MVGFGDRLTAEARQEWCFAYVDYDGLKRQLDLILAFQSGRRGARPQKAQQEAVAALKLMFQASLDAEIAKVVTFYKQKILDIGNELRAMQVRRQELMDVLQDRRRSDSVKLESVQEQQARWRNLAVETKWLLGFISLNMSGIRKIVKKFSKNVGAVEAGDTQGPKLVSSLAIRHPHEPSFEIHQASFLSAGLVMDLDTMQRHKELSETQAVIRGVLEQLVRWKLKLGGSMPASSSAGDLSVVGAVNDDDEDDDDDDDDGQPRFDVRNDTGSTVDGESSSVSAEDWRWLFSRTHSMLPDFGDVEQLEPILKEIRQEAEQAERNAALVVAETSYLSAQLGVFEEAPADQDATATSLGILLNLLNVLLYMLNYNLAIPTTEKFCSHLGVPAAVGGMVIGASDITALVVALGYSAWTNYSFKIPLLFSAAVCLSGNILYSLAYDLNSLPLLIAGRLLIGAGAARALNRRYIADFVRRKDRTMASAMFVAASAGGMALGPLLALPLAAINTQSDVMGTLNDITVGGWSMVVVWAAFILVAAAFFGEPLKRRPPPPLADLQEPLLPADGAAAATKRRAGGRLAGVVAVLQDAAMLPTLTCVLLLFMLKLLQQGTVSATPLFVGVLCDWQAATAGLFLCIAAVAMLPLNFGVGVLSKRIADRPMIIACLVLCLLGCVTQIQPAAGRLLTSQAYFFGYMVTYASTIVLEGVTMSAMSKVMNPTWARGTFNMGLLATQSGSTGRLLGNLSITWLAEAIGLSSHLHRRGITALANVMYSSFLAVVLLCVLTLAISYRRINV